MPFWFNSANFSKLYTLLMSYNCFFPFYYFSNPLHDSVWLRPQLDFFCCGKKKTFQNSFLASFLGNKRPIFQWFPGIQKSVSPSVGHVGWLFHNSHIGWLFNKILEN